MSTQSYTDVKETYVTDLEKGPELTTQRQRARKYCICGSIWGLKILAAVVLIDLLLAISISRSLFGLEDDPDKIFGNWGQPGTATEGLAWYPTDFLRDVVPIPCHSHNDYWRKVPLFSALHAGCVGTEADVWLLDDGPALYVGHDPAALTRNRTFKSLYIDPLVELLDRTNPETEFYNDPYSRRGVFDVDPGQTLILLIDVKTEGASTWDQVLEQLEPLRSRGWLSYVENGKVHYGPVTVVGTGNTPFDSIMQNSTYRDTFFDAPLGEMWEDPDVDDLDSPAVGSLTYDATNSIYASVSFKSAVGAVPLWKGLDRSQLRTIRGQLKGAHRRGLNARYWDLPAWPISLRNQIWHDLMGEGMDFLNVDDLRGASRKKW
ncbi:uncharacterized protein BCR38DRAFT_330821 [Pseudomassariella vexata]|uniref:Altered inheritance of mitochondria protein 6 n=1 Tax=Pseudomassariella vexata TaxID=1141098 RepID=A0A1Y2EIN1_9PEZI|nr:uncharacterized protein BCR38DRAFT_330821 [Pseudomassariella vexata]ORY71086.1 hypothetical protein BCR38DRAFT_330821 [Pseudomassariella vexata]